MKYSICQNRDALRRMKKARVYRAEMKHQSVAPCTATSAHGRSSVVQTDSNSMWRIMDAQIDGNHGRVTK